MSNSDLDHRVRRHHREVGDESSDIWCMPASPKISLMKPRKKSVGQEFPLHRAGSRVWVFDFGSSLQLKRRLRAYQRVIVGACLILVLLWFSSFREPTTKLYKREEQVVFDACSQYEVEAKVRQQFVDIRFEEAIEDDILTGWEEDWVAFGQLPYVETGTSLGRTKFDAVVSWVNGSDHSFASIRKQYAIASHLNRPETTWLHDSLARHREWAQVQWALISCIKNLESLNRVQLLTSHEQVPEYPDLAEDELQKALNLVDFLHDVSLFEPKARKCAIPTFNSVSIEVNMGDLPSNVDKFIYLCDDMLLTTKYRDADLYTPLFGLSMIIYDALVWNVDVDEPYDPNQPNLGEYPEYHHSSSIFNAAFGKRNRAYVRHATKVYSRKLLREVRSAFPAAYADASMSRFRGDRKIINPHFFAHHYVIERHRKALLWSFLELKSDLDADGLFSWSERKTIQEVLDAVGPSFPKGNTRSTQKMMNKDLYAAGFTTAHALKPRWSSFDGPPYSFFNETPITENPRYHEYKTSVPDKPRMDYRCEIDYDECFGRGFFTNRAGRFRVTDILRRFSKDRPVCGDCLINKLVLASGSKGLNAFLPTSEYQDLRDTAVKAIMRYSYTKNKLLGNMVILGPSDYDLDLLKYKLDLLTQGHEAMPSQMCINDDVPMDTPAQRVEEIRQHLTMFYRSILDGPKLDPLRAYESPVMPQKSDYL